VRAIDQSNIWLFSRETTEVKRFEYDLRPPRIDVLSGQHYIHQGGSEAILYRVSEKDSTSGVQVGDNLFRGYPIPEQGEGAHIALFALAHDQGLDVPIFLWAEDSAGNLSRTRFWVKPMARNFRRRRIEISDRFIESVSPEILTNSEGMAAKDTPLETFLEINGPLRERNNRQIRDLTLKSQPRPLWTEPFLQLTNSQVESAFADHRSYYYQGKKVDEQTHLGFDLASLARSAVEASNSGVVVFADYLGIYGNCVILDHGLGLFSLYGHLSSIEVAEDQQVKRQQSLGRTGQTGLAGGDHLHYSMIVQGIQISPLEWWDPDWVRKHLWPKLDSLNPGRVGD
jgi:murein DD-endopeptidase MepM/ murein hydrolase activator NlpD